MENNWQEQLACAVSCTSCGSAIAPHASRILSSYTHKPICMACKHAEEQKPDYAEVTKDMIGRCMAETEILYGEIGSFCYHHFYPFKC